MSVVLRCEGHAPHHTKSVYRGGARAVPHPGPLKKGAIIAPPLISELSHFSNFKLKSKENKKKFAVH